MRDYLKPAIADLSLNADAGGFAGAVQGLFHATGHYEQSLSLLDSFIAEKGELQDAGAFRDIAAARGNMGACLLEMGRPEEALPHFIAQERACRSLEDLDGLQRALGNQGLVLNLAATCRTLSTCTKRKRISAENSKTVTACKSRWATPRPCTVRWAVSMRAWPCIGNKNGFAASWATLKASCPP